MFDFHVLDMFELGIEKFVSLKDVKVRRSASVRSVCLNCCSFLNRNKYLGILFVVFLYI